MDVSQNAHMYVYINGFFFLFNLIRISMHMLEYERHRIANICKMLMSCIFMICAISLFKKKINKGNETLFFSIIMYKNGEILYYFFFYLYYVIVYLFYGYILFRLSIFCIFLSLFTTISSHYVHNIYMYIFVYVCSNI